MGELINGRTPEEIKRVLEWANCACGNLVCEECQYYESVCSHENFERIAPDALALIQHLESERDAAIRDLKLISHCYTCSNRDLDKHGECKNSGGGGAPFMQCSGYVWDKKLHEPPKEGE